MKTKIAMILLVAVMMTGASYATIGWANYQWPCNGAGYPDNQNITIYSQAWKGGCTDQPSPCAGLSATISYKRASQATWTTLPMAFFGKSGNNDEYSYTILASETVAGDPELYSIVWHDASDNSDYTPYDHCGGGSVPPMSLNITPATAHDVLVTFQVNMTCMPASSYFGGVFVAGDFQGWSGCRLALSDPDNDHIFTGTYMFPAGSNPFVQYKFNRNDGGCQWENSIGNRTFTINDNYPTMTLPVVDWNGGEGCILPVELSHFDAVAGDGNVTLNWTTASETNNASFEIVRDGTTIDRVNSLGNTATGHNYSWTDRAVVNGTRYSYALVAVETNGDRRELGTQSATPTVGAGLLDAYTLSANYPNPFNPTTKINYSLKDAGTVTLNVYDLAGRTIATLVNGNEGAGNHTVTFDGANLPSGIYYYTLKVNGFSATHKMVLMK